MNESFLLEFNKLKNVILELNVAYNQLRKNNITNFDEFISKIEDINKLEEIKQQANSRIKEIQNKKRGPKKKIKIKVESYLGEQKISEENLLGYDSVTKYLKENFNSYKKAPFIIKATNLSSSGNKTKINRFKNKYNYLLYKIEN